MSEMKSEIRSLMRLACRQALLLACGLLAGLYEGRAQDVVPEASVPIYVQVGKTVYGGDSIPEIITPPLYKYPPLEFKDAKQKQEWNLLVSNVKKLLPIAKKARFLLIETYEYAETLPDEKSKREHYKLVEQELKEKYSPMVKRMPRSQGRLLVKLVDRECGQSAYAIAKAFVGSLRANLYQGLGLLFGNSLTKHYDPQGDDRMTERVVRLVESGQL